MLYNVRKPVDDGYDVANAFYNKYVYDCPIDM